MRRDGSAQRYVPAVLGSAALAAVGFVWWVASDLAARDPLPGRPLSEPFTTYVAMLADVVARLAGLVALSSALAVVLKVGDRSRLRRWAGRAGQAWLWAAVLSTAANPAYVNGLGLGVMASPGQWLMFQINTPSSLAWLFTAAVAATLVVVSYRSDQRASYAVMYGAGVLAWVFVMVTGNVTVGLDHDWATDAVTVMGFVLIPTLTAATAIVLGAVAGGHQDRRQIVRYHRVVPVAVLVSLTALLVVARQQLAGAAPGQVFYGLAVSGAVGCLLLLGVSWVVRQVRGWWRPVALLADAVIAICFMAVQTAEAHIPSPRFFVPQSSQVNYLGYEVLVPPTIGRLLGLGRPNLLWLVVAATAIGTYLVGVVVLRRRGGDRWPVQRLLCWLAGWLLVGFLAATGLWEYSTVLYSWHMVVHMTVNMLIPVLLVLGAPLTLLGGLARTGVLTGLETLVGELQDHRLLQRLLSPPVLWANYVGSLFLVYFTPLFGWLMRYHWAHQLMLVYFLLTGYLFFALIVGVDRQPWNLPYIVRLALVISIMPFHAIFAVSIMSSQTVIGEDFYKVIALPWVKDLLAEQNIAGQATWLLGEVPLLIVMVALSAQWFVQDRREAAAGDAAVDSGADDSVDAYNDMLAELAARDEGRRP